MKKELLTELVSFKISKREFKPYGDLIKKYGYNKSKLFREIFIDKGARITPPEIQSKDNNRIVFLANKTSNNINQIARKLNESHKSGAVTQHVYIETLNRLISIEKLFKSAIKNVS